jgi:polysaccharide biosynthesis protein PslH
MARLLWLSAETPDVNGSGGQRRQFHQIRAVREGGIEVAVATLAGTQDDSTIRSLTSTHRFPPRPRWPHRRNRSLERLIEDIAPVRAVVAHVESAPHVLPALQQTEIPFLIDFHNVLSRWHASLGEAAEAAAWRERERKALITAERATACSPEERNALVALGTDTSVDVCPHGVDPDEWPASAVSDVREPAIALFGSWQHGPNRLAAEWLADEVWPRVRDAVRDARLVLLGPGQPPASLLAQAGVELRGRVDSLAEALGRVRVAVVPIRGGMGARMKFVESLASGAAVVSTTEGAEGFDADAAFLRADDAMAFSSACADLLRDSARAEELGRRGRDVALERYTWRNMTEPIAMFGQGQ